MLVHADLEAEARWTSVRARFPFLERCVYLNTAGAGLSWEGQGAAAGAFYDDAKALGYNGMEAWRRDGLQRARAAGARLLSVPEDEIGFAGSTTEGLNLAMNAIPWRPGDEIVLAADEFPSVVQSCEGPCRLGATVRQVAVQSELQRTTALISALTPATRALAVSHVHWCTGTRVDLELLSSACAANETFLIVDGAQALGAVAPRIGGADVYCASVFKWLLSGFGLAVFVVRSDTKAKLSPLVRGYNNPAPSSELLYSHVNHPGLYALAATLELIEQEVGWDPVYRRVDALASDLAARLGEHGLAVVTPPGAHAGIVSCVVPNPENLRDTLAARGAYVEARQGFLRASPHFYNTHEEVRSYADLVANLVNG
jgi:selenocysteine lyase/cysteine desulfurase